MRAVSEMLLTFTRDSWRWDPRKAEGEGLPDSEHSFTPLLTADSLGRLTHL